MGFALVRNFSCRGSFCLIRIGRDLTAPLPLPHHRTEGTSIRWFGRVSQGNTGTPTRSSLPGMPVGRRSQASNPRGNTSPNAIGPLHPRRRLLSTVRAFSGVRPPDLLRLVSTTYYALCRLLPADGAGLLHAQFAPQTAGSSLGVRNETVAAWAPD